MKRLIRWPRLLRAALTPLVLLAAGCGGGGTDDGGVPAPTQFTLGGSVSGLTGDGLVLTSGSDTLAVPTGSSNFTLPSGLVSGSSYSVTVLTQPAGQTCSVASGSGTMGNANVGNVVVTCSTNAFTLGGSINGLGSSGLVLANGADRLSLDSGATSFTLPSKVAFGSSYSVTVQTQPIGQTCAVSGGSGTMGDADVNGISVSCGTDSFTLGGGISGLTTSGLVLASGSDTLAVAASDSGFTMPTAVGFGSAYDVTVQTQPVGLTCSVANGSGTMGAANVINVAVTCSANAFALGGSLSGLSVGSLTLANGSDEVTLGAGATRFTFPAAVAFGSPYNVRITAQPQGLTCTVTNGSGTMGAADVRDVVVTCSPRSFTLGGSLRGLASGGLVLANGTDTLNVVANATSFTMPKAVALGSPYNVTVKTQALDHTCAVANGGGTMPARNVGNVAVTCVPASYTVGTVAGSGVRGFEDGRGTAAAFRFPFGAAVDSSGNVYVADTANNAIRKISRDGTVSTLAGSGQAGNADGVGTAASFDFPTGVAVDGSGTVYVADQNNLKIRRISPDGTVSTLPVETPVAGLAVDARGTLYVADPATSRIFKVSPDGAISLLAGSGEAGSADGSGALASFNQPSGVAIDADGHVVVADTLNHKIRKITPAGVVSTLAGSGVAGSADGQGTAASFNFPGGVAVDGGGNVIVADSDNHKIRKIARDGTVRTLAGTGSEGSTDGLGTAASFIAPQGVAVDSSGNVLVADTENHRIRRITRN